MQRGPNAADMESDTTIEDIGHNCLHLVFGHLSGTQCGIACCVSRSWRQLLADDLLWKDLCSKDYDLRQPIGPEGDLCSWRRCYALWCGGGFLRYGPLAPRAQRVWTSLRQWTARNLPEVAASLRPGVTELRLAQAEEVLGFALPAEMRASYRFCDGQDIDWSSRVGMTDYAPNGLFGGYEFYHYRVTSALLNMADLVNVNCGELEACSPSLPPPGIKIAVQLGSSTSCNKVFVVNRTTAEVGAYMQAPRMACGASGGGGMLQWLEEFAARLKTRRFRVVKDSISKLPATFSLSLFDCCPSLASETVSNGVRVSARAAFVPEKSCIYTETPELNSFFFAYSVHFALLSDRDQEASGVREPIESAKLQSRHWIVRDSSGAVTDRIDGDGVLGEFPVLRAGAEGYRYTSCMMHSEPHASMEGHFLFTSKPGSLSSTFEVQCSRFILLKPSFIY